MTKSGAPHHNITRKLILCALLLLILALGFNAMLSLNSLEKLYVESIASQYSAIGRDLQRNLEKALQFGKNIRKFVGMNAILDETQRNILESIAEDREDSGFYYQLTEEDVSVSIVLPDGQIIYSTDAALLGEPLPEEIQRNYDTPESSASAVGYAKYQHNYITSLPIRDRRDKWLATAVISFNEAQIQVLLQAVRNRSITVIGSILLASVVLLLILLRVAVPTLHQGDFKTHEFPKMRIYALMFLVIGLAQVVFSVLNTNDFRTYYLEINKKKTVTLTNQLKEDIEFFLSKGLSINKLVRMDQMLGEIITSSPELNDITVLDKDGSPLYMATKQGAVDLQKTSEEEVRRVAASIDISEPEYNVSVDLVTDNQVQGSISANMAKEGYISTNLSKEVIYSKLFEIALDSATILVISFLFFGELLILIFQYIEREISASPVTATQYQLMRPAIFLFLFGIDISLSFLPLHMETLYEPIWGLSKDMVMGLPISSEMLFAGFTVFLAGFWTDKRGWQEPLFAGILFASGGALFSGFSRSALELIVARGIVGAGYGMIYLSAQAFIVGNTDESVRARGFSNLEAGLYAGTLCGSATGGMLAERIGFSNVFFAGAGIIFLSSFFIFFFLRRYFTRKSVRIEETDAAKQDKPTIGDFFRFIFDRNVFSVLLINCIPNAILLVGFVFYLSPIYLNRIGTSQSNIARALMVFGFSMVYLAPLIGISVDRSRDKKLYLTLNGFLAGVGLLTFYFFQGFVATIIVIFMLSIANSIGYAAQAVFILDTDVAKKLGAGKTMSIYRTTDKIGQVLGPLVIGAMIAAVGIEQGMVYAGLLYLFLSLLFILLARNAKPAVLQEDVSYEEEYV